MKLVTIDDLQQLLKKVGFSEFIQELSEYLEQAFYNWKPNALVPRLATHLSHGVIELMPYHTEEYYAFKYVNGHPNNPEHHKLTVVALGLLAEMRHGYPLMVSEMTLLTALRTAVTSAVASKYLANPHSRIMAIIGSGAQAEFQVLAHHVLCKIEEVRYFDIDPAAMEKFAQNLSHFPLKLIPCQSVEEAINGVDIITTATASKRKTHILENSWIKPGVHINGIGGDCPGKTELDPGILTRSKVVVEYLPQTLIEGEIQNLNIQPTELVYAELWEIISGHRVGREHKEEITLFDSVGFAIEDYAILRLVYDLCNRHQLGSDVHMVPEIKDPKNLFSLFAGVNLNAGG